MSIITSIMAVESSHPISLKLIRQDFKKRFVNNSKKGIKEIDAHNHRKPNIGMTFGITNLGFNVFFL